MPAEDRIPKVIVSVLSWNACAETLACLRTVANLDYPRYDVIVVDNGSSDGTSAVVRERFSAFTLISLVENRGFSGGHNVAIDEALARSADYVLLLNNDTRIEPQALTELVGAAESEPRVGVVGGHVRRFDGTTDVVVGFDWRLGRTRVAHRLSSRRRTVPSVDSVSGAAMLLSRQLLETVGKLDERFFLYFEDQELCRRAADAGFGLTIATDAKVWHRVAGSTRGVDGSVPRPPEVYYYLTRNNILLMRQYRTGAPLALFMLAFSARTAWIALRILGGRLIADSDDLPARVRALARGWADGVGGRDGRCPIVRTRVSERTSLAPERPPRRR